MSSCPATDCDELRVSISELPISGCVGFAAGTSPMSALYISQKKSHTDFLFLLPPHFSSNHLSNTLLDTIHTINHLPKFWLMTILRETPHYFSSSPFWWSVFSDRPIGQPGPRDDAGMMMSADEVSYFPLIPIYELFVHPPFRLVSVHIYLGSYPSSAHISAPTLDLRAAPTSSFIFHIHPTRI